MFSRALFSTSMATTNKRAVGLHRRLYSITADAINKNDEVPTNELQENLRPTQIVEELDKYVVGQKDAKRAVAIALRNRWRRRQLPEELRKEIVPRNVLLVGPTGCGKTEVARRMAMLNDAPFIKVEATKFTEVGYHGRDVEKIIVDLLDISIALTKKRETEKVTEKAKGIVEEKLLERLMGPVQTVEVTASKPKVVADDSDTDDDNDDAKDKKDEAKPKKERSARDAESFRSMLKDGLLEDQEIDVDIPNLGDRGANGIAISEGGGGKFTISMDNESGPGKLPTRKKKLPIKEARKALLEAEIEKLLQGLDLMKKAIESVEQTGIVFLDEIDKICTASGASGRNTDASAEGVQRDLLPLVEGTTVSTKHGNVNTDYILFVASGAFHAVKPSDMLPELQGRLPVRVQLKGLTEDDLYKILTEPVASMIRQQVELLKTEGVELVFEDEAIREIARMAYDLNKSVENIGARRLHTVMEKIMEEISFEAAEEGMYGKKRIVTKATVEERLKDVVKKTDLSKFIL